MKFCKSCGAELSPEVKFCNSCGAHVEETTIVDSGANYRTADAAPTPIMERHDEPYYAEGMYPGMAPAGPEVRMMVEPRKKGIGAASVFNIILGIVIVLLIGTIVFLFFHFKDEPKPTPISNVKEEKALKLSVDETPESTAEYSYTLSGKYTVKGCNATMVIKGVDGTVERTIEAGAEDKTWQENVSLNHYGDNYFEIEIYDPENKDETLKTETVSIKRLKYAEGTILAKDCGYNNKLKVRSSPDKLENDSNVIYKIHEDYEDVGIMRCLGEEVIKDDYTWVFVEVHGYKGWVGTDGNVRVISTP